MEQAQTTWRFPIPFWTANSIELFERWAYYGTFIALAVYLTSIVGYTDVQAGWISGGFAGLIYLLPFATGAAADRMGFRPALMLAFLLLSLGYTGLGLFPAKLAVLGSLALIAVGGAFVKPIITGTVSRYSDSTNRARAFSLFYMVVNIGAFTGKSIAGPARQSCGVGSGPLFSAGAALVALGLVALLYRPKDSDERPKSFSDSMKGLGTVLKNGRFLALILITAGFWAIQGQLYASMPKYVLRTVGAGATPEWYANVNPLVVMLCVVPITHLVRRLKPVSSIAIALALIPMSSLVMALSPWFPRELQLFGSWTLPAITLTMVLGIALQGLAECFLSPRYLEFASKQAPKGQEGLYMGYSHLNTFFAWLFGFIASGYLLETFCPDPTTLSAAEQAQHQAALAGKAAMPAAYAQAHFIWYAFAMVGIAAFVALVVFQLITRETQTAEGGSQEPTEGGA